VNNLFNIISNNRILATIKTKTYIMKKIQILSLSLILMFGLNTMSFSQLNNIDFLKGGVNDAKLLFQEYLNPYANIFGANLNAGWYNTAKPHKLGGFDVTITTSMAWAPSADRMFNVGDLALSTDASYTGGPNSPTIAGKKTSARPEIVYSKNVGGTIGNVEYARYKLPDGTGLNFLPLPMAQVGIGLPFGTEITGRFLPNIDLGESGNIGLWGIGLKHSIIQHIPGLKRLPILDITAQGAYTKLKTYANMNYDPLDIVADAAHDYVNDPNKWLNQRIELGVTAWTANIVVSETLPVISFYQAIGYSSSKVNLGLTGNFPFPSIETTIGIPNTGDPVIKNDATGIVKDPIDLDMQNNKDLRLNAGMRLKLGVLTIHFDYTKANYSVFTTGLGISFR
jgi:hypothetical protein